MTGRGIVIEFDFAAMNGAELLFKTTKKFLRDLDKIPFDESLEARCLAGCTYADGLARLLRSRRPRRPLQRRRGNGGPPIRISAEQAKSPMNCPVSPRRNSF